MKKIRTYRQPKVEEKKVKINFFASSELLNTSLLDNGLLETKLIASCQPHYDCSWLQC